MDKFSPTTLTVWRFLAVYIDQRGYAPTLREVAAGCAVSQAVALRQLVKLEGLGVIEREEYRARAIKLVERPPH